MGTEQKESLETKTCCDEPAEDRSVPQKYRDKDWKDFYFVTLLAKMTKKHPIEKIANHQKDYKCCSLCKQINWHRNNCCTGCGNRSFSPMDDENAKNLLLDWQEEPDLLLEV